MTLSQLYALIGDLTNDPNGDRYTSAQKATELDNSQDKWNIAAYLIKDTTTITVVAGTRQYALSGLNTPIEFSRATHRGIELAKRSKSYFDLYVGDDWTDDIGTPTDYFIEAEDPDLQYLSVFPTPQDGDAGANLVVEYIRRHTSMSGDSDVPFMSGSSSNPLLRPYDYGLAYDVAARLLARDPSPENARRAVDFEKVSRNALADVIQVFKALEKEEPWRLVGGRNWIY
jgi:hypothetical protein